LVEDHTPRATLAFTIGACLAINGIRDGVLLVEGPDCVRPKAWFLQGAHDLRSTLTSVSGHDRVTYTGFHPTELDRSRESEIRSRLEQLAREPTVPGVLFTSLPAGTVTSPDYEGVCRQASQATGKPIVAVPGKSLGGDWLTGYSGVLASLARFLDLDGGHPSPERVAIVGHLYDRNEADQTANVREMRRLLEGIGLDVVSIWLEGQSFSELSAVRDAGTILSFPYGRRASGLIARRTGARLIECELPFGLPATERWIRQVATETGREAQAEVLIHRELSHAVPPLEWMIPFLFEGRRAGFIGDPFVAAGVAETLELLGGRLTFAAITDPRSVSLPTAAKLAGNPDTLVWPHWATMERFVRDSARNHEVTLLVTTSLGIGLLDPNKVAVVEFGFPSYYSHCLWDRPFLGFRGFLGFVDRIADSLRQLEVRQTWRDQAST
jgi:nitrogenase molybdenum-iron protein alpha/beta subunit